MAHRLSYFRVEPGQCTMEGSRMMTGSRSHSPFELGPMQSFTAFPFSGGPSFHSSTPCSEGGANMQLDFDNQRPTHGDRFSSANTRQPKKRLTHATRGK